MKLHEENLKKIIEYIEMFGAIRDVNIKNNETILSIPDPSSKQPCPSKLKTLDLNRPKEFTINFVMGDTKEKI